MNSPATVRSRLSMVANRVLGSADLALVRRRHLDDLYEKARGNHLEQGLDLIVRCPPRHAHRSLALLRDAKAQLFQDLFVLNCLDFKENGYFVEFGATNGKSLSNTWLLEKAFGWAGILAEPARSWHDALRQERSCAISTECVWKVSGERLSFTEAGVGEFSTLTSYGSSDMHAEMRRNGREYEVQTVSLNDLLRGHDAPRDIDYVSIDTEGSEYEILAAFDFSKYDIKVITVEHNHTGQREKLKSLLESEGFVRVLEDLSRFDDWYVRPDSDLARLQLERSEAW